MSLTRLIKNEFKVLFFMYLQKGFFAFGILDARFEPKFRKKLLNVSAMEVSFAIIYEQGIWRGFGFVFQRYN